VISTYALDASQSAGIPVAVVVIVLLGEAGTAAMTIRLWRWTRYFEERPAVERWWLMPPQPAIFVAWTGLTLVLVLYAAAQRASGSLSLVLAIGTILASIVWAIGTLLALTVLLWGRPAALIPPRLRGFGGVLRRRDSNQC